MAVTRILQLARRYPTGQDTLTDLTETAGAGTRAADESRAIRYTAQTRTASVPGVDGSRDVQHRIDISQRSSKATLLSIPSSGEDLAATDNFALSWTADAANSTP